MAKMVYRHYRMFIEGEMQSFGGATVALVLGDDDNVRFGMTVCSPRDSYRKIRGLSQARKRACTTPQNTISASGCWDTVEAILRARVVRNLHVKGSVALLQMGLLKPGGELDVVIARYPANGSLPLLKAKLALGVVLTG